MTQPAPVSPQSPPPGTPHQSTTPPPQPAGAPVAATGPAHSQLKTPNLNRPLIAFGLFIAGVFGTLWATGQPFPLDFFNSERQAARLAADANRQLQQSTLDNSALATATDNLLSREKWSDLQRRLKRTSASIAELQSVTAKWNSRLAALRTSEQGNKLAGHATLLEQFAALAAKPRVTADELETWSQQLRDIDEVVTQALDTRTLKIEPKAALEERLQGIQSNVEQALRSQRSDDAGVGLLLDSLSESDKPSAKTLAQALTELEQARIRNNLAVQAAEVKSIRDVADAADQQNLRETEQQKVASENARKKSEREVEVLRAKNDAEIASEEVQDVLESIETARKKREHVRRFEADLPEMRRLLAPLITPGKTELAKDGWRPIQEARPVSLSALAAHGLLREAPKHMVHSFMQNTIGPKSKNGRPMGSFPVEPDLSSDATVRMQYFLKEYGDILIERKMLLP